AEIMVTQTGHLAGCSRIMLLQPLGASPATRLPGKCWAACPSRTSLFASTPSLAASLPMDPASSKAPRSFAVEACLISTEVDFGAKLRLYRRAGVREYVTVELTPTRIVWRILRGNSYYALEPDADGLFRSITFPGLWLDRDAFWRND